MSLQLLIKEANIEIGRYSVQPTDQIFVISYGFFSFCKNMSSEYSQKVLDQAK